MEQFKNLPREEQLKLVTELHDSMAELCEGVRRMKGWSFANQHYKGFIDYFDWTPTCNRAPTWQRQMILEYIYAKPSVWDRFLNELREQFHPDYEILHATNFQICKAARKAVEDDRLYR